MSGGTSTSMKTPFQCKFWYSSAITSTQPLASSCLMASLYDWGVSAVRYKVPMSSPTMFSSGPPSLMSLLSAPTEVLTGSWLVSEASWLRALTLVPTLDLCLDAQVELLYSNGWNAGGVVGC